jgi:hypothetical protein
MIFIRIIGSFIIGLIMDRNLALDVCVAEFKRIHMNKSCKERTDLSLLRSWYEGLNIEIAQKLYDDDVSLRGFLGYGDFCLDVCSDPIQYKDTFGNSKQ